MKKSLVLFLVATLLLAGCTELMSDDGETTVEVNEEVALEKILDIVNPSEDSSWGMTYVMEMDMDSMMGSMSDMDSEDDSDEPETSYSMTMTQAMSPNGVHMSQVIKMSSEDTMGEEIEIIQKWTQTGNVIYLEVGYSLPTDSDMSPEERAMYEEMMGTQEYKMQSALSHTEVMAIMNEPMNDDDFNPQEMLTSLCMIETLGTFTPLPDEDGLTMYKVSMENNDIITGEQVLKMWDSNNDQSLSWDEFNQDMCGEQPFEDEEAATFEVFFNDADVNNDAGLTLDELDAFIADVDEYSSDDDFEDEDNDCDGCEDQDDMDGESMEFDFAFNNQGNVEFFRMDMGNEGNMIVYLLSDSKIESLTTSTNDGESVALPFVISSDWDDDMDESDDTFMCDDGSTIPMSYVNDGDEDCDGGEDETGGNDHSNEPMFQYECIRFVDSFAIDENNSFNMTYDDTNIDSTMCGEIVSENMQTHNWDSGEFTMPENFTYVACDDDGENCEAGDVAAVTTVCELCDPETELYDTFVSSYSECTEDGSDYDNDTGMCTHYIGTLWNSDSMAFEFVNQPDSTLVYYQYDAGTNSGLLMVVAGDEDENDDGNNGHGNDDDGHDESNPGNSHDDHDHSESDHSEDKTMYISAGGAMMPFEGEFSNYWIELASCSEEYDDETDEKIRDCTPNRQVVVTNAAVEGGSSGVMFHDADNSGTISDGDMIHITDEDAMQFDVRLYSISADAYSDENPVLEMPGFTGVVGVLALLGAALLRRKA